MTNAAWMDRMPSPVLLFLSSPRLSAALTTLGIGLVACGFPVVQMIGVPGYVAAVLVLLALMGLSFSARWRELEWHGLLPISLLGFLGWSVLTILWSEYQWVTLAGLLGLLGTTLLALYIALLRDTIQILRSVGSVLRVLLGVSLGLEIFSGILIDTPIPFLDIEANIALLGPISGVFGVRNQLGLLAIIGMLTFGAELRTRSVGRGVGLGSLALALVCGLLTRSPVIAVAAVVVAAAVVAIYGVRRVPSERRPAVQIAVLVVALLLIGLGWLARGRILALFNAGGEAEFRLRVWNQVYDFVDLNQLEGWGWAGRWPPDVFPFAAIDSPVEREALSASNAYLDVWFQLGLVGFALFLVMAGLAFTRSWLLAGRRRSVVYAWPATVLVALLVTSLAESSILVGFGWLTFVICCVKASQELSWRNALGRAEEVPAGGAPL